VNCSASVAHFIADEANRLLADRFDTVDGVVGLSHGAGCCMTIGGEGLDILQKTMAGFAKNPNFGGILVVGLGCEVNLVSSFMDAAQFSESPLLKTLDIQKMGGTKQTLAKALELIEAMLPQVAAARREPVSAAHIVLGLECGGSDAYSGSRPIRPWGLQQTWWFKTAARLSWPKPPKYMGQSICSSSGR
jgi:altronate dehydratase